MWAMGMMAGRRDSTNPLNTEISLSSGLVLSPTEEEAKQLAMALCLKKFPFDDGWQQQSAVVNEISIEFLAEHITVTPHVSKDKIDIMLTQLEEQMRERPDESLDHCFGLLDGLYLAGATNMDEHGKWVERFRKLRDKQ